MKGVTTISKAKINAALVLPFYFCYLDSTRIATLGQYFKSDDF